MTTDVHTVIVQILNKTYTLKCPSDQTADLQCAAMHLDKVLRQTQSKSQHLTIDKHLIGAALNICGELLTTKRDFEAYTKKVNERLGGFQAKIDSALTSQTELHAEEEASL